MWTAQGLTIPSIYQISLPTVENVTEASQIPLNSGGYMRGFWRFSIRTPLGKLIDDVYRAKNPGVTGAAIAAFDSLIAKKMKK